MKNDADKAHKFELLAKNAEELISELTPIDNQFLICLNSRSLAEIKEKILEISIEIDSIIRKFEKGEIPEDAICLLSSKATCFTSLLNALEFKEVDLKKLRDAGNVFEEWNLNMLAMAVDSLGIFIGGVSKYKNLEEIPAGFLS